MKKLLDFKSVFVGIIVGSLLFGGIVTASTLVYDVYLNSYPVYANGSLYKSTSPLLNYQGKTYVPLNEFGKLTNSSVNFSNNTIYVNSNANSYYDSNYNYFTYADTSRTDLEVDVDDTESFYVNLSNHNSRSANITYSSSYIKLSRTILTYSGTVAITGKKEGKATIKVSYSSGDVEYIDVIVNDDDEDYEDEIELDVGDTDSFYIDLDDYDADKATLSYDSDYIKLSKTSLTSSSKVTITAKEEGESTIKIKYNTGDVDYIYVTVNDDDDNDRDDDEDYEDYSKVEVDEGDKISFYIDLDYYDADKATLSYDSDYVKLSKTTFTSSGNVTITGKNYGTSTVKVKYDSGDVEYIKVKIY